MTDFGLSRMGLLGRQKRANDAEGNLDPIDPVHQGRFVARPSSRGSSRSTSYDFHSSPVSTPVITPETPWNMPSYFNLPPTSSGVFDTTRRISTARSVDGDDNLVSAFSNLNFDSKRHSRVTSDDEEESSDSMSVVSGLGLHHLNTSSTEIQNQAKRAVKRHSQSRGSGASLVPPAAMALFDPNDMSRKFVGTPDYLAPETIDGTGQDRMVDWWAVGCILFEFLYGYPPFHDESPEKVFENILARRIDWPEDEDCDVSEEARDILNKLLMSDQTKRLGAGGADEVKSHAFFANIAWDTLFEDDTPFVPQPEHPEDTDYFDSRGLTGTLSVFPEEELSEGNSSNQQTPEVADKEPTSLLRAKSDAAFLKRGGLLPLSIPPHVREQSRRRDRRSSEPPNEIDFGSFVFKNLPVLEKANKDTIERLRAENASLGSPSSPSSSLPSTGSLKIRPK